MTDEDLLAISPRDLTQEALTCYAMEMERRQLAVEIPEEVPEQERQRLPAITVDERVLSFLEEALSRRRKWSGAYSGVFSLSSVADGLAARNSDLLYGAIALWFLCVITTQVLLPRMYRGRAPILWLRKFRPRSLRGFSLETFLFGACNCLGIRRARSGRYSYDDVKSVGR